MFVALLFLVLQLGPGSVVKAQSGLQKAKSLVAGQQWREAEEILRALRYGTSESGEASVLHALCLVQLGQPFDAVLELEELLKREPENIAGLKLYATLVDRVVADTSRAEEVFLRCTTLAPADAEAWKALGSFYLALNRVPEAIRTFERAAVLVPSDPVVIAALAYANGQSGSAAKADADFAKALEFAGENGPGRPVVLLLQGEYLLRQDRLDSAVRTLSEAYALSPDLVDALAYRAVAFERLKQSVHAEADALTVLEKDPKRKDVHQLLIRLYRSAGNRAKSQEYASRLQQIIDEENRQKDTGRRLRDALNRAEPLLRSGKLPEAIVEYESIVALLPTFYEAHFALGMCYFQTGRPDQAEASFRRYLELQPLSADGHCALGVLLVQRGRVQEAVPTLTKAVELDPGQTEARRALAQVYYWSSRFQLAADELEAVIRAGDGDVEAVIMLARCRFALGERDKAVEVCNRGLSTFNQSPEYLKSLAQLLLEEEHRSTETRQVIRYLARSLSADPDALFLVARHAFLIGDFEECEKSLTRALTLGPTPSSQASIHSLLGQVAEKQNEPENAEAGFKRALDICEGMPSPDPVPALLYARFLTRKSRDAEAQSVIDKILHWAPYFAPAHLERAKHLVRQGKRDDSIVRAQLALKYAGNDRGVLRDIHSFLARTLFAAGRSAEAREHQAWLKANSGSF